MKTGSNRTKSICLRITKEQYEYIVQQSSNTKISINSYITKRIFEQDGDSTRYDRIMQLIPKLYTATDEVENAAARSKLKYLGGQICQCLK